MCVCVWVRENSPPHLCLWVRERPHLPSALPSNHISDNLLVNRILDGRTDGHTQFSAETLNPKPGHTQEDTLTVRDTHYGHTQEDTHYTEWYPYPEFSEPTQEFTHYTEVLANRIWLGKDCCLAEFQHFILRCIKISLLCGYHWKRGEGVEAGPKTGWLSG